MVTANSTACVPLTVPNPVTITSSFESNDTDISDITQVTLYVMTLWATVAFSVVIFAFGVFGNVMSIVILYRIGSGTTNMFFIALSISDLCLLSTGTVPLWWLTSADNWLYTLNDIACKLIFYVSYASGTLSAWLLVGMTVQRAVSIAWPHRVRYLCSKRNSLRFIAGLTVFVLLMQSHILYGIGVKEVQGVVECIGISKEYAVFFDTVWSLVDLLSYSFCPFVILFISNGVLVWNLQASVRELSKSAIGSNGAAYRKKRSLSVTVTLILVSSAYFVMTMPYCLVQLIAVNTNVFESRLYDFYNQALYILISNCVNMLWVTYSGLNFYLYCLTGAKFRNEFKSIMSAFKRSLCKRESKRTQDRTHQNSSSSFHNKSSRF